MTFCDVLLPSQKADCNGHNSGIQNIMVEIFYDGLLFFAQKKSHLHLEEHVKTNKLIILSLLIQNKILLHRFANLKI